MPVFHIRDLRPHEHAAAAKVTVEGYRDFYGAMLGDYADRLRDVATRVEGGAVLVAVEGDEILGTVTYVSDPGSPLARQQRESEASIRMLAVAPNHKRHGIGRALSLACIERAKADGKRAVVLHADQIMQASRALYEALGFRRDPSRDYAPDDRTLLLCYVLDVP